jgi:nitroreductase
MPKLSMQTMDAIMARTSVREYKTDPITDKDLNDLMEAAINAPSSGNVQDWEFVVVKTPEGKSALAKAAFDQSFVSHAPCVIVVCSDMERIGNAYGNRGEELYSIQNTSAAIQNLMLAAWDKGIGSCWIGAFNEEAVKEAVILPANVRPLAIITLGYPVKTLEKPRRRSSDKVVHWETF